MSIRESAADSVNDVYFNLILEIANDYKLSCPSVRIIACLI